jgi:hypothetical protein
VEIQGVSEIHGEKVFVLRFIQGRNPDRVQRPYLRQIRRTRDLARPAAAGIRRQGVLLRA